MTSSARRCPPRDGLAAYALHEEMLTMHIQPSEPASRWLTMRFATACVRKYGPLRLMSITRS